MKQIPKKNQAPQQLSINQDQTKIPPVASMISTVITKIVNLANITTTINIKEIIMMIDTIEIDMINPSMDLRSSGLEMRIRSLGIPISLLYPRRIRKVRTQV